MLSFFSTAFFSNIVSNSFPLPRFSSHRHEKTSMLCLTPPCHSRYFRKSHATFTFFNIASSVECARVTFFTRSQWRDTGTQSVTRSDMFRHVHACVTNWKQLQLGYQSEVRGPTEVCEAFQGPGLQSAITPVHCIRSSWNLVCGLRQPIGSLKLL